MNWIKEANKIGKYHTTYNGFRIYITKQGSISESIEERSDGIYSVKKITTTEFIAIDKTGLKLTGSGLEDIGYKIDFETLKRKKW